MAMKQEVNVPLIATIGAVSVILLVVVVIGASAWFFSTEQDINAQNFDEYPDLAAKSVVDGQEMRLTAPAGWSDAGHSVATIPIDQAMQVVIATQGKVPMADVSAKPASVGSK